MAVWVKQQLDSGKSMADIQTYLKKFDVWDRYDLDGDGVFNEPDGYIDHMQVVHAGGDEAPVTHTRAPTPSGATAGTPTFRPAAPAGWLVSRSAPTVAWSAAA